MSRQMMDYIRLILYRLNGLKFRFMVKFDTYYPGIQRKSKDIILWVIRNWFIAASSVFSLLTAISVLALFTFHQTNPNRGYDLEVAGSIFYNNPFTNISIFMMMFLLLWVVFGVILALLHIIQPIIKQEKANLEYFQEYGNLKPEGAPSESYGEDKLKNDWIEEETGENQDDEDDEILRLVRKIKK